MCNFNKQTEDAKSFIHLFMIKAADSVGGANFLLALIESMKAARPALAAKNSQIASEKTIIKWNKVVFKDKVELIQSILDAHKSAEKPNFNILDVENAKRKKNILNMIRALTPIEFVVTPQNPNDGEGFNFKVFTKIEEEEVILNPVFIALFFCSIDYVKKALKHEV